MKTSNAASLTGTMVVRSHQESVANVRPIDFRSGPDHIQGRRGVDYATSDLLVSLKATHRIGVQRAVAGTK
jgi:hypothetical protein